MNSESAYNTGRWSATASPAELTVRCGRAEHRLIWDRGEVTMLDHPDADAEVALVALGGDEPACLSMLRLWELAIADGGFLEEWVDDTHLSPARLSWLQMALERLRNEGFHEFLRSIPTARAEPMGRFLHRFPRPWLDRAAATVAETIIDGDGVVCANAAALLEVAATQRVRRAFVASVGGSSRTALSFGAAALVPLTVAVRHGETAVVGRLSGPGRAVSITVDERWLHQVWAAGASVIDDRLIVALDATVDPPQTVAIVVEWEHDEPVLHRMVARHDQAGWSLGERNSDRLGAAVHRG